jgi:hypothetical protein
MKFLFTVPEIYVRCIFHAPTDISGLMSLMVNIVINDPAIMRYIKEVFYKNSYPEYYNNK